MRYLFLLALMVGLVAFAASPPPILHTVLTTNSVANSTGVLTNDGTHLGWTDGLSLGGNTTINYLTVTNVTVIQQLITQYLVTSNIVAANIQGTPNTVMKFTPDGFSGGNSRITEPDTNTTVFNGSGSQSIAFGGTTTNTISINQNNLLYKSADPTGYSLVELTNSTGSRALAGLTPLGATLESSGSQLQLGWQLGQVVFSQSLMNPPAANTMTLGSGANPFLDSHFGGKYYSDGLISGAGTNYSRLAIYHQGTNGAAVIDSQSSGIAGAARPLVITNAPAVYNGIASWSSGTGSPEGVKTAPIGSIYCRTDGGAATSFYVKESGSGNVGWVAK